MKASLSQDLRRRVRRAAEAGSSRCQTAERFQVSPSAVIKLMRRVRQTGSTAPAQIGGYRRPILEAHAGLRRSIARRRPPTERAEIQAALRQRGIAVRALSTVSEMLHRLGVSHKKTR